MRSVQETTHQRPLKYFSEKRQQEVDDQATSAWSVDVLLFERLTFIRIRQRKVFHHLPDKDEDGRIISDRKIPMQGAEREQTQDLTPTTESENHLPRVECIRIPKLVRRNHHSHIYYNEHIHRRPLSGC